MECWSFGLARTSGCLTESSGLRSPNWAFASSPGRSAKMVSPSRPGGLNPVPLPRLREVRPREVMTMTAICRHVSRLTGYAPALPTPFDDDDNVDTAAFEQPCDRQIHEGATALVVCG